MSVRPATMQLARRRWADHTRHVITTELRRFLATHGRFFAHDPYNRAPVVMTRNGDGTFMPLFWFYDDGNVTFASGERLTYTEVHK